MMITPSFKTMHRVKKIIIGHFLTKLTFLQIHIMRENNGLNSFLTYDEVNLKFEDINRDEYLSLKVVITQSAQRLGKKT